MKYHNNEVYILQDTLFNAPTQLNFVLSKAAHTKYISRPHSKRLSKNKFSKTIAIFGYIWYNEMSKF